MTALTAAPEAAAYVTELAVPEPVTVLQVLHSRMLPPDPEPVPELEAGA